MIWMRGVENTINTANGQYYVTNAVGMGNYGAGDSDTSTSNPVETGKREEYRVKNVYDLAGNAFDWTFIKVNTKITKKGKIKITNLDNFLLYRIVKVFYFI